MASIMRGGCVCVMMENSTDERGVGVACVYICMGRGFMSEDRSGV